MVANLGRGLLFLAVSSVSLTLLAHGYDPGTVLVAPDAKSMCRLLEKDVAATHVSLLGRLGAGKALVGNEICAK
jgi:hypothetical protein